MIEPARIPSHSRVTHTLHTIPSSIELLASALHDPPSAQCTHEVHIEIGGTAGLAGEGVGVWGSGGVILDRCPYKHRVPVINLGTAVQETQALRVHEIEIQV